MKQVTIKFKNGGCVVLLNVSYINVGDPVVMVQTSDADHIYTRHYLLKDIEVIIETDKIPVA